MKKFAILTLVAMLAMTSAASAVITLTNPDGSFYAGPHNGTDVRLPADKANDQWIVHPTSQQLADNGWVYDVNFALSHGMANPFHAVSDYSATDVTAVWSWGSQSDSGAIVNGSFVGGSDGVMDAIHFGFPQNAASYVSSPTPQLTSTIRIVTTEDLSDDILNGTVGFVYDDGWGGGRVSVLESYNPIPEPATMSLLAIGGVAALIRRKK